jgi:hypothetical protein
MKNMSMADPLGALLAGSTTSTIEVEEDIDGRPPEGVVGGSGSVHHRV